MDKQMDEQKLFQTFSNSVGYLLAQSARLFRERLSEALKPLGLSVYEYGAMRLISLNMPVSQGLLGSRYGIDRTTMVAVVDSLEERGMVTRERSATDRRSYRLLLTTKGKKVLSRALRIATSEQEKFLRPVSASDWNIVRDCLWRLIETHGTNDLSGEAVIDKTSPKTKKNRQTS
jgi:MarR family transcriptional regulator, lower aerobic nicotinate degradation pathway regulator